MPDRDQGMRVGEVIDDIKYLLDLPTGTVIGTDDTSTYPQEWTRVVNGYICTKGNPGVDTGHFVANDEVFEYYEPGYNQILRLPEVKVIENADIDPDAVVITKDMVDAQASGCGCTQDGRAEAVDAALTEHGFPDTAAATPPRAEVLREAEALITGDRNKAYGPPTENFRTIADLLTTRFKHMLSPGEAFTGSDVADLMILVKVARNIADNKKDTWVDIAGYAACGYECTLDED